MQISRILNFKFAGISLQREGVFLQEVKKPIVPKFRNQEFSVPKRAGIYRYKDSYEAINISVKILLKSDTREKRKQLLRELLSPWLNIKDKLIFEDEPNLYYEAEIVEEIGYTEGNPFDSVDITFSASPFKYELWGDGRDLLIKNTYGMLIKNADGILINAAKWFIETNVNKKIINKGNALANPTIEIEGVAKNVSITIKNRAFTLSNLNGIVFVDTEKMIVYEIVNNQKKSRLIDFLGEFPQIYPGDNDVFISGENFKNLSIEIRFRNTYII